MARKSAMDDDQLSVVLDRHIKNTVGYLDSKLSQEREKIMQYYNGDKPAKEKGRSRYVSFDVYDAVESMKAQLQETFSGGSHIVKFSPTGPDDVDAARIATEYCSYVLFRENNGFMLFGTVIHDGLVGRNGIAKVYWEHDCEETEYKFKGLDHDSLSALLNDEGVKPLKDGDITQDTDEDDDDYSDDAGKPPTFSGSIFREYDNSGVRVAAIPPEEFLISPRAPSIKKADFVCHRSRKSLAEIDAMGIDTDKLDLSNDTDEGHDIDYEPETITRFNQVEDSLYRDTDRDMDGQPKKRLHTVYECYMRLDLDGKGRVRLWKITKVGKTIADKEKIDRVPFLAFCPLPQPHSFWGSSYANKVIPTQDARTVLTRGILDHTVMTNNPRYGVVNGAVRNPKELMENRFGGFVNLTRPDGVFPLPQASLNPFVFQAIQMLDEDKEETTGISRLSQGMNKDAVSKQNSQGMIQDLIDLSQIRQKIIARNFAEGFLTDLYLEIYRLVLENEKKSKIIQVAGSWTDIDVTAWIERTGVEVSLALGYGEQDQEAQKWAHVHQALGSDPNLQPVYGLEQRRYVVSQGLSSAGFKDINKILLPTDQVKPPQPDPMQQAQVQQVQVQNEVAQRKQSLDEAKHAWDIKKSIADIQNKSAKIEGDHALKSDKLDLDEAKLTHEAGFKLAEIKLQEQAQQLQAQKPAKE